MRLWLEKLLSLFATRVGGSTLLDGLLGWWSGDQTDSGAWDDRVGANDVTLTGPPTIGTTGLVLDGTAKYGTIPQALFPALTAMSVCCWARVANVYVYNFLVARRGVSGNLWGLDIRSPAKVNFEMYDGTWRVAGTGASTVSADTWTHVVATYDASSGYAIYLDGSPASITTSGGNPANVPAPSIPAYIGTYGPGSSYMSGIVDDVRIYNRALSAAEVAAIYAATSGAHS